MENIFEDLMAGLDEVESYMMGKREGYEVHMPAEADAAEDSKKECSEQ